MAKNANALKYITILIGLLIVAALTYWGLSRSQENIVARVGPEVITKDELYNFMVQQTGQEASITW